MNLIEDEELVAVIAASLAAAMGTSIPKLNIKSIKRVSEAKSNWELVNRQKQVFGSF